MNVNGQHSRSTHDNIKRRSVLEFALVFVRKVGEDVGRLTVEGKRLEM